MKEIIDLRKKREKHFRNDDGTFVAYMYDEDVHYLKDGKYEEIDNTLISKDNSYENKNNSFKVRFDGKSLYELFKDTHFLKVHLYDNKDLQLEKDGESIKYINTYDGIDFVYNLTGSKVKENIILKNKESAINSIDFKIETDLSLSLSDDKEIMAKFDDNVVFRFEVPFMYDVNKTRNNNLCYVLEENNDFYILKLLLDTDWLNDNNTKYPVIIDPTVNVTSVSNFIDSYILSTSPTLIGNNSESCFIGVRDNKVYRSLIRFSVPQISPGYTITNATIRVMTDSELRRTNSNEFPVIAVHRIANDWNENNACWNNMSNNYINKVEAKCYPRVKLASDLSDDPVYSYIDITNIFKRWLNGEANYGLMLKYNNENVTVNSVYCFNSNNYSSTDSTSKPILTIRYIKQSGIIDYMTYTDVNYNNGVSKINNFNGDIINIFDVNKTQKGKFPVDLSIVNYLEKRNTGELPNFTNGWKFNLTEYMELVNGQLIYHDSTNCVFYFINDSTSNNIYRDEDGLNLKVEFNNNCYTMTNIDNNKKIFTSIGDYYYLTSIINYKNDEVNLTYTNGKLTKIVDGSNREISINYTSSLITVISDYDTAYLNLNNGNVVSLQTKKGLINFQYDSQRKITKITNTNGISYSFEYYSSEPYKVKKVTNYGINDSIGKTMTFNYENKTTAISVSDGIKHVYSFDDLGHTLSIKTCPINDDELINTFVSYNDYYYTYDVDNRNNKLLNTKPIIKYVKNLLTNSGFEDSIDKCNFTINGGVISNSYYNSGNYSLNVSSALNTITFPITDDGDYTFSLVVYLSNILNSLTEINLKLFSLKNGIKTLLDEFDVSRASLDVNEKFNVSLTGYFENNSSLILEETHDNVSNVYFDDLQLEKGRVANLRNLVENSDFDNGITGWDFSSATNHYEIVTINDDNKALKIISDLSEEVVVEQDLKIHGKEGERFALSFWYKNEGCVENISEFEGNTVILNLFDPDTMYGQGINLPNLISDCDEWQYKVVYFTAQHDFEIARLIIMSLREINNFYITNIMIFKDPTELSYEYDEEGRIINYKGFDSNKNTLRYDESNQLVSMFNPMGNNYKFEYDSNVRSRLLRGISPTGISNEIIYDNIGNPVKTRTSNVSSNISDEGIYHIRVGGNSKYLSYDKISKEFRSLLNSCNKQPFKLKHISDDIYQIILVNKHLTINDNYVYLSDSSGNDSKFIITINENGSYSIKPVLDVNKRLIINNDVLVVSDSDSSNSQFYFEDTNMPLFIENTSVYTNNGDYIKAVTDETGQTIQFDINENSGLTNSIIYPNGTRTDYMYNTKENIVQIIKNNKTLYYTYNNQDQISSISDGINQLDFLYDDFLNVSRVKLNNNNLITYDYDSITGKLTKITYGNGAIKTFEYDTLNRTSKIIQNQMEYDYEYDSFNNLSKINSNSDYYSFDYDISQQLITYVNNNFKIDYQYDINGNVTKKNYSLDNMLPFISMQYQYNDDNNITKVKANNTEINYNYDYLGRLSSRTINNSLIFEYHYLTRGDKTSNLVESVLIDNDLFHCDYDNSCNITKIFKNGILINEFKYDLDNQLTLDIDYLSNRKTYYVYNTYGNIVKQNVFDLENKVIEIKEYQYNDNNTNQLSWCNNQNISYDNIGNPISIGNAILTWKNGRELESYIEGQLNINYNYNIQGYRTSKTVNGITTYYYLDNDKVILEKQGDNMIYYLWDFSGNVYGFRTNGNLYYYKKNIFGDIIGLYDENYNILANYYYDAWGKLLKVEDGNGNLITDTGHIAYKNSYRYRNYFYDSELGWYYLNKRYYNPEWKRFVNIDDKVAVFDLTVFKYYNYCVNNPINFYDKSGDVAVAIIAVVTVLSTTGLSYLSNGVYNKVNGKPFNENFEFALLFGAVDGVVFLVNPAVGVGGQALMTEGQFLLLSTATSGVKNTAMSIARGGTNEEIFSNILVGTASDFIGGYVMQGGTEMFDLLPVNEENKELIENGAKFLGSSATSYVVSDNISGRPYITQETCSKREKIQEEITCPLYPPTSSYLENRRSISRPKKYGYNWYGIN